MCTKITAFECNQEPRPLITRKKKVVCTYTPVNDKIESYFNHDNPLTRPHHHHHRTHTPLHTNPPSHTHTHTHTLKFLCWISYCWKVKMCIWNYQVGYSFPGFSVISGGSFQSFTPFFHLISELTMFHMTRMSVIVNTVVKHHFSGSWPWINVKLFSNIYKPKDNINE